MRAAGLVLLAVVITAVSSIHPRRACGAQDVLVEISLAGVAGVVVVGGGGGEDPHDALQLPASDVLALLGLSPREGWITLDELREVVGPAVDVRWEPRQLRVVINDPYAVLPATRKRRDAQRAAAIARPSGLTPLSGPFGSVTYNSDDARLLELGYVLPWASIRGSTSTISGEAWAASVSPFRGAWITYTDSERRPPVGSARLSLGPTWLAADYTGDGRLIISGAAAWRSLAVYAAPQRDVAVLTVRGAVDWQLGWSAGVWSARAGFGPTDFSPLAIPAVR